MKARAGRGRQLRCNVGQHALLRSNGGVLHFGTGESWTRLAFKNCQTLTWPEHTDQERFVVRGHRQRHRFPQRLKSLDERFVSRGGGGPVVVPAVAEQVEIRDAVQIREQMRSRLGAGADAILVERHDVVRKRATLGRGQRPIGSGGELCRHGNAPDANGRAQTSSRTTGRGSQGTHRAASASHGVSRAKSTCARIS